MKKYIIFMFLLMMTLSATAKKKEYVSGEPWPENGYDLSYYASGMDLYINRFADNDTLYYLKMRYYGKKNPDDFYFITIPRADVDTLLINILTTKRLQNLKQKSKYINTYLKNTKQEIVWESQYNTRYNINDTQWTLYKSKKNQTFNTKTAELAYTLQRTPKKNKQMTFEEWSYFYENMKFALKFMGGGTDSKTLYDKIMQDGGY